MSNVLSNLVHHTFARHPIKITVYVCVWFSHSAVHLGLTTHITVNRRSSLLVHGKVASKNIILR